MSRDARDLRAAEYVLGTLAADERARVESELESDAALRERVEFWVQHLAGLEPDEAATAPPARLWPAIARSVAHVFPSRTRTMGADDGDWRAVAPGVACKMLHVDGEAGIQCYLLRLEPGAELAAHGHRLDEECVVLEGELGIDGVRLGPGGFHLALAGSTHPTVRAHVTTVLYLRGEVRSS